MSAFASFRPEAVTERTGGRTLLVASTGGHLSELVELYGRLPALQQAPLWFVPASQQTTSLLQDQEVVLAPDVEPRDVRALPAAALAVERLLRHHDVDCVVSTGAAVAVTAFGPALARGISCHYIESAARVQAPSLTGRLVQTLPGVHLWSQHQWERPGRWLTAPSVFDGFQPRARSTPVGPSLKVVVTLGTTGFHFRRLLQGVQAALPAGATVLWQTGATDVTGLGIDAHPWMAPSALAHAVRDADVVVAHAGVGSALIALSGGSCPVLVPRRRQHREHVDDHQVQVAAALAERGLATAVEADDLCTDVLVDAARRTVDRVTGDRDDVPLRRSRRW